MHLFLEITGALFWGSLLFVVGGLTFAHFLAKAILRRRARLTASTQS